MSYRLTPGEPVSDSVQRIGAGQISYSLAQLASENAAAVHETRKAIKRLRALLALIKPAIADADYRREGTRLRSAAQALSGTRDTQAALATVAKLERRAASAAVTKVCAALRSHLEARHGDTRRSTGDRSAASALLTEARDSFAQLSLDDDSFAPLAVSFEHNYRRTRRAFARAFRLNTDEAFHNWRKLVQRYWRHLRLIAGAWPEGIRPHVTLAQELSKILGDINDLSVLAALIQSQREELGRKRDVEALLALCRKRQAKLRLAASTHGARLFAEKPGALAGRIQVYWNIAAEAASSR